MIQKLLHVLCLQLGKLRKILNFKFTSVSEAKLAASFCSEKFGSKISEYNIIGLNIFISQSGDLNVSIKFENSNALNKFETNYEEIISDLKKSISNHVRSISIVSIALLSFYTLGSLITSEERSTIPSSRYDFLRVR